MAGNPTMRKLQTAINGKGGKVLIDNTQFWSDTKKKHVIMYHVKQAVWDEDKQGYKNVELFRSCSQIQVILFLRDMWYTITGQELPTDNAMWNDIRNSISSQA